jgi:hypothetical protein
MSYIITTICFGVKYEPIRQHWIKRITDKCKQGKEIVVFDKTNVQQREIPSSEYAWWDVVRLNKNILLCLKEKAPIIHIDMDIVVENELADLTQLPYDFIISTEIGGNQSFPKECSQKLGFGVCSGFYIIKPSAINFMMKILSNMKSKKYGSLSDQVNIMNFVVNNAHTVTEDTCVLNGVVFKNKIIQVDGIKICVLDFGIITRDPILTKQQYGNHINVDNVGGVGNFINYFYQPLESLPLTCRCNKKHLGDNNICTHLSMRGM